MAEVVNALTDQPIRREEDDKCMTGTGLQERSVGIIAPPSELPQVICNLYRTESNRLLNNTQMI